MALLHNKIPIISQIQSKGGTYTFASQPRAIYQQCSNRPRRKYRESNQDGPVYGNIMYDRRIVRGFTIPHHTVSVGTPVDIVDVHKQQEVRKRIIGHRHPKKPVRSFSPPPIRGREHMGVQTEIFLEELAACIEVTDGETQTEAFLDRPATPVFTRAKTGDDAETQIYEGELFDFDYEVIHILEVLVGKTVEQSLMEIMEEEELASLREQQHKFEELRNVQLAEQQRLEEQEHRLQKEKNNRLKQHMKALKMQQETSEKVASLAFTQNYLADLAPVVFQNLTDLRYFYDPIEKGIEQSFMPWLLNQVTAELNRVILHRSIVDGIICEIINNNRNNYFPLIAIQAGIYPPEVVSESHMSEIQIEEVTPEMEVEETTTGYYEEEEEEECYEVEVSEDVPV